MALFNFHFEKPVKDDDGKEYNAQIVSSTFSSRNTEITHIPGADIQGHSQSSVATVKLPMPRRVSETGYGTIQVDQSQISETKGEPAYRTVDLLDPEAKYTLSVQRNQQVLTVQTNTRTLQQLYQHGLEDRKDMERTERQRRYNERNGTGRRAVPAIVQSLNVEDEDIDRFL